MKKSTFQKTAAWMIVLLFTAVQTASAQTPAAEPADPSQTPVIAPEAPADDPGAAADTTAGTSGEPDTGQSLMDDDPLSPPTPEDETSAVQTDGTEEEVLFVTGGPADTGAQEAAQNDFSAGPLAATTEVTQLPGQPVVTTFSNEAQIDLDQPTADQFRIDFDITAEGAFGGAIINFGASPSGPQDLSAFSAFDFELATSSACTAQDCVKVEFVDASNQISVVNLSGIGTELTPVTITLAELQAANPNVDFTQIKQINFVIDQGLADPDTGFLEVRAGGLAFTPTVAAVAPAAPTQALPGTPVISSFSNESTITVEPLSDVQFAATYDLSTPGSFAGAIINYMETPQGSQDLSTLGGLAFNIRTDNVCTGSSCMKIEVQDAAGQTAIVNVFGLDATFKEVSIPFDTLMQSNPGLDLTQIRQINFVLEEANLSPKAGFMEIQIAAFDGDGTPTPDPDPDPDPTPDPDPDPTPDPDPVPGDGPIIGLQDGETVNGVIQVRPAEDLLPEIKKVAYYLDGTKAGKEYEAPYTFGGAGGFDTTKLPDGTYTLSGYYTTDEGDQPFSITFTVSNGAAAAPVAPEPNTAPEGAITGLADGETVSGVILVRPDIDTIPDVHKVFYYLNGTLSGKYYSPPFYWGGESGFDTTTLPDGNYTLSGLYGVTDSGLFESGDYLFSIDFIVANGSVDPVEESVVVV